MSDGLLAGPRGWGVYAFIRPSQFEPELLYTVKDVEKNLIRPRDRSPDGVASVSMKPRDVVFNQACTPSPLGEVTEWTKSVFSPIIAHGKLAKVCRSLPA